MATRTLGTKLTLTGEAEYNAAIKRINSEHAVMRSELKLLSAQFNGNANSYDALTQKVDLLSRQYEKQREKVAENQKVLLEAQQAQQKYGVSVEEQRQKIAGMEREIDFYNEVIGDSSLAEQALLDEIEKANAELQKSEGIYDKATAKVNDYQTKLNLSEAELKRLDNELQTNKQYMDEAEQSASRTASSIDEFGKKTKDSAEAVSQLGAVLSAAGVAKLVQTMADAMRACVDASIEFEAAIAAVQRTVGGSNTELLAISDGMKALALEIPITTTELGKIAETAGQLGIAQEDVLLFTEIMAKLGTATDLTAENAATMLAQFANITGLDPGDYDRLGATVASLGDATATTASKVVDMSQGMAAAASLAGFTEKDILALAAAVGSLGIESQAGSTAMSTMIQSLHKVVELGGDKLESFASIANMTATEFSVAWKENAVEALDAFIQGLNDVERNGMSATVALDELGITNQRQLKAILGLAEAGDLLSGTIEQSTKAWEENAALEEKAGIMYDTLESKTQLLENSTGQLCMALGDQLTPAISNLTDIGIGATQWLTGFVEENEWVAPIIAGITVALGASIAALTVYAIKVNLAAVATVLWGASLSTILPVVAAIAALAGAVTALTVTFSNSESVVRTHTKALKENRLAAEEWQTSFAEREERVGTLIASIAQLSEEEELSVAQQMVLMSTMNELNELLPGLGLSYDALGEGINKTAEEMRVFASIELGEEEQARKVDELRSAQERLIEVKQDLIDVQERIANGEEKVGLSRGAMERGTTKLAEEERGLKEIFEELVIRIETLGEDINGYNDAVNTSTGLTNSAAKAMALLDAELDQLETAYAAAKEAAYDSLTRQIGQWEVLDNTVKTSVQEQTRALQSQAEYYANYNDNLLGLMDREIEGIDLLAAEYLDGSKESAAALAGLADATDDKIREMIESARQSEELKTILSGTIGDIKEEYSTKLADIEQRSEEFVDTMDQAKGMTESGKNTMQGYINGLLSQQKRLETTMLGLAGIAASSFSNYLVIRSPSKLFERYGLDTMQGYVNGVEEMRETVSTQMEALAQEAESAFSLDYANAASFDEIQSALDYARAMDLISDRQYYDELLRNRDKYLRDVEDKDRYNSVTTSIYAYEKQSLADAEKEFLKIWEETRDTALKSYQQELESVAETAMEQLNDLQKEMEAVQKARDSMAGSLGDYGELYETKTIQYNDGSSRDYTRLADIDKQIQTLRDYEQLLADLNERGLAEGLMGEVVQMNVDDALEYGKLLMKQSDQDFEAYSRAWEEKQKTAAEIAERYYKDDLDILEQEYQMMVDQTLSQLDDISTEHGEAVIAGLIQGMEEMEPELRTKLEEITQLVDDTLRSGLKINSPSKLTEELGKFTVEGFEVGWDKEMEVMQAKIDRAIPSVLELPPQTDRASEQTSAIVNAIGTMTAGMNQAPSGNLELVWNVNGVEFYRATLPDFRTAQSESPIEVNDSF